MNTGRAIVIAAVILAAVGAVTAWLVSPRYSLTNPGAGVSIRLNRASGDMLGCERLECRPIVEGDKAIQQKPWEENWDAVSKPAPLGNGSSEVPPLTLP